MDFDSAEQRVKVSEDKAKTDSSFDYFFAEDRNYRFEKKKISNTNKIIFQKSPALFEINDALTKQLKLIKCPDITTADSDWKKKIFLIDPGHKGNDGYSESGIYEGNIVGAIGSELYDELKLDKAENVDTTRDNTGRVISTQVRKDPAVIETLIKKSEVIISLHVGKSLKENNNIKIYVSSVGDETIIKKREKMGCLILNELFSDSDLEDFFTGGNVIKINPEQINEDYEKVLDNKLLDHNKISIVVEIGNIQNEKIRDLNALKIIIPKVSSSIFRGITEYYG